MHYVKENSMTGYLALEDGTVFTGRSFGAVGEQVGEVVFNTSMCGYQEILTDPSYYGQIVAMTYPLIGNYGVNDEDTESDRIHVRGFVVKEACRYPSNSTSRASLPEYLIGHNIIGIEGIDTRALTRRIRQAGAMKACLYAGEGTVATDELIDKARAWEGLNQTDTVRYVTCANTYQFDGTPGRSRSGGDRYNVVAFDFGIKHNILRMLRALGCRVTVMPASTAAEQVLAMNPDGIFLSNGPGDPRALTYAHDTIRRLLGTAPVFGICLGHQLLTLALGAVIYKLRFGHHGGNHPVRNLATGEIEITSQNHNYCTDIESLEQAKLTMTHLNLYDKTCEGLECSDRRAFSVQYHPEASPGPHDSSYLFRKFVAMMECGK